MTVVLVVEGLARASRHLVLSGDWMVTSPGSRAGLETGIRRCLEQVMMMIMMMMMITMILEQGRGRKEVLEAVLVIASKPWDSPRMRSLLTGSSQVRDCTECTVVQNCTSARHFLYQHSDSA